MEARILDIDDSEILDVDDIDTVEKIDERLERYQNMLLYANDWAPILYKLMSKLRERKAKLTGR